MYFKDKTVWITGASSGIGEGLVYALARQGANLILTSRRADALEQVRARCETDPARIAIRPFDLTDLDALPTLAADALNAFGRIDILVNNAGGLLSIRLV